MGPGSPQYLTGEAVQIISGCDVVVGYEYTLNTIRDIIGGKQVHVVTMSDQESVFVRLASELGERTLVVPFTGDASFSESEVVDRLTELFGKVVVIPGISSVVAAAARTLVPLDKARVMTFHVTAAIEEKKTDLARAVIDGFSVIVVPRPWPRRPDLQFMPAEIAAYLRGVGVDTESLRVEVFESLSMPDEACWSGTLAECEGREFGGMTVFVLNQAEPDSYINYRWQWDTGA